MRVSAGKTTVFSEIKEKVILNKNKISQSRLYCEKPNPTLTQPNLTKVWVLHENDFTPPPPPTTENSMSALSQLFPTQF